MKVTIREGVDQQQNEPKKQLVALSHAQPVSWRALRTKESTGRSISG
jgi:hypothetical protein